MLTLFQKSLLGTVAVVGLLLAFVVAAKGPAQATTFSSALQLPSGGVIPPGIVTTGDATVRVRPDAAIVTVGAVVQAATAGEAQALLASHVDRIVERAKALQIEDKDTKTVGYRIDPQYAYEQAKAPRLVGFQAVQQIELTIRGTDGVGKAVDALVQNDGATTASVQFTLLDSKAAEATAREQAIQDARAKAQAMARTAGVALGKVLSVNDVGLPAAIEGTYKLASMPVPAPRAAQVADLPTGQLEIVVRVQVQFEIV